MELQKQKLAGIRPLAPGFKRVGIRPQLTDLEQLELITRTAQGPQYASVRGKLVNRHLIVKLPPDCGGELALPTAGKTARPRIAGSAPAGHSRCRLPTGETKTMKLITV